MQGFSPFSLHRNSFDRILLVLQLSMIPWGYRGCTGQWVCVPTILDKGYLEQGYRNRQKLNNTRKL